MAASDRVYLGGSTESVSASGDIHQGSVFVLTAATAYVSAMTYFTALKTCKHFKVENRGRDLASNPIVIELPNSVANATRDVFTLDLNNILYSFHSVTIGDDIFWNWTATESKVGV